MALLARILREGLLRPESVRNILSGIGLVSSYGEVEGYTFTLQDESSLFFPLGNVSMTRIFVNFSPP